MIRPRVWLIAIAAFLSCAAGPAGPDNEASSYRLSLPLTLTGDAPVQRVRMPLEVLIASKGGGYSDIRVFDANGRVVPMARMPALAEPSSSLDMPAMPILKSQRVMLPPNVSVKIEEDGRTQSVTVDGKPSITVKSTDIIAVLFDARGQIGEVEQLVLKASIPEGQPVTFLVEASEDLKSWRPLGEAVDYRAPGGGEKDLSIALAGRLSGRTHLRVTWRSDAQLLAPVIVRGAKLSSSRGTSEAIQNVSATVPPLLDPYTLEFAVPFATPILTIAVDAKGGEGLVPIKILGRNSTEEAWSLLGQGRAEATASAIALRGLPIRMIRIEADRRVSGFAAAPSVRLGFASPEIAFVTTGKAPFKLMAGHPAAADVFLPINDIARGDPSAIPEARISTSAVGTIVLPAISSGTAPKQTMVLWIILVGATVLLAGIAWHLWSNRDAEARPKSQS